MCMVKDMIYYVHGTRKTWSRCLIGVTTTTTIIIITVILPVFFTKYIRTTVHYNIPWVSRIKNLTRGQSNLAKAASNALHTLHAWDSITIAVPKIWRGSQKLKVGHVTQMRTRIWLPVAQFLLGPPTLYMHAKFPEIWGGPKIQT